MSTIDPNYYEFGHRPETLLLVRVRDDGQVEFQERKTTEGGWQIQSNLVLLAPKATEVPATLTFVVKEGFGSVTESPGGWSGDPYDRHTVHLLGIKDPFEAEVLPYANSAAANAVTQRRLTYEIVNAGSPKSPSYELRLGRLLSGSGSSKICLNGCFKGPGERAVFQLGLRLAPGSSGHIEYVDVSTTVFPKPVAE